jgi:prolyl-tRNA synthetase
MSVATVHVSLINLMIEDKTCAQVANRMYEKISNSNLEILYDDRDCSIGKKLSDNDLIGIPYQIIIGKRDLKNNIVELKNRLSNQIKKISPEEALNFLSEQTITEF